MYSCVYSPSVGLACVFPFTLNMKYAAQADAVSDALQLAGVNEARTLDILHVRCSLLLSAHWYSDACIYCFDHPCL